MRLIYKILFALSLILIILSLFSIFSYGLKLGIDFKGGSALRLEFENSPDLAKIKSALRKSGAENFTVSSLGQKGVVVKTRNLSEQEHQNILLHLKEAGNFEEKSFDSIGPLIGRELKSKSLKAILISLFIISIYLAVMFKKVRGVINSWSLALSVFFAGAHDLLIPLGVFAYLGKTRGIELDAPMIAAALTIIGYSINDTIVVFDRIRENVLMSSQQSFSQTVHLSVKQTLFRSLGTSLTTLFSLIAIFFYGGETLKNFSLALIIGIGSGAYSSIAVASPLLMLLPKKAKT